MTLLVSFGNDRSNGTSLMDTRVHQLMRVGLTCLGKCKKKPRVFELFYFTYLYCCKNTRIVLNPFYTDLPNRSFYLKNVFSFHCQSTCDLSTVIKKVCDKEIIFFGLET